MEYHCCFAFLDELTNSTDADCLFTHSLVAFKPLGVCFQFFFHFLFTNQFSELSLDIRPIVDIQIEIISRILLLVFR